MKAPRFALVAAFSLLPLSVAHADDSAPFYGQPAEQAIARLTQAGFSCGGLVLPAADGLRSGCMMRTTEGDIIVSLALNSQMKVEDVKVKLDRPASASAAPKPRPFLMASL